MAQSQLKEFFMMLIKLVIYWLEAVIKCILPSRFFRKDVSGQRVLITGAGSGLGKLMAYRFMRLGCDVVLWDINGESMESMVKDFQAEVACKAYTVDLASREQVYQAADRVKKEFGTIDILVNNAGIVTGRKFLDCPDSLIQKTMEVNANAHFWKLNRHELRTQGSELKALRERSLQNLISAYDSLHLAHQCETVKAFLPDMLARNSGHVVSIASSAGLFGVTGLADYCASKFAAVGFMESLYFELEAMGKTGVHTTVVCPYFINTGMFDGVVTRFPSLLPILNPDRTMDKIMDAILCNQAIIILPRVLYSAYGLKGLLPTKVGRILNEFLGVSESMNSFVGRSRAAGKSD